MVAQDSSKVEVHGYEMVPCGAPGQYNSAWFIQYIGLLFSQYQHGDNSPDEFLDIFTCLHVSVHMIQQRIVQASRKPQEH